MTLESKKVNLAQWILSLSDEVIVDQVQEFVRTNALRTATAPDSELTRFRTTIEDRVDLDKIKREQGFTTANRARIEELIVEADIPQSIDELLADLT